MRKQSSFYHWILLLSLLVGGGLSLLASEHPDGLERVAEERGFADRAVQPRAAPLPDYRVPGLGQGPLAASVAGLLGVGGVFGLLFGLAWLLRRMRRRARGFPKKRHPCTTG